jgi:pilus assembly protein Flp/PilA
MADEAPERHAMGMSPVLFLRNAVSYAVARMNLRSERGATAVEYGLMVMLVATVIMLAVVFLGQRTSGTFSCTARAVSTKSSVAGCG